MTLTSFQTPAPWVLDLDTAEWRQGIAELRATTRDQVPAMLEHHLLPPGGRVAQVAAVVGGALGGWALKERRTGDSVSRAGLSRRLRQAFTRLGPTYIKMGQVISSGEGIFPEELVAEFRQLRDRVPAEPFETVRRTVEADFGRPLEEVFAAFATEPVAAASIAQVHLARLVSGEEVAVKVQRPGIAQQVNRDIRAMAWLAHHLVGRIPVSALANPPAIVELLAETIVEELDFRLEADSMLDIAKVLDETGQQAVIVPRPHPTLVTPRVLVMERLEGFTFDDVAGMRDAGIDTSGVARALMVMVMEGCMIYGVFHGDLHGGNLLVLPDGRVGLLDYGITGRLTEQRRGAFLRMMMSSMTQDTATQMGALRDLGAFPDDLDITSLMADLDLEQLQSMDPTSMDTEEMVAQMRDLTKKLLGHGAKLPKELLLFMKNLMFLDGALATLAPDVNLLDEMTHVFGHFATHHGDRIMAEMGMDVREIDLDLSGLIAPMMGQDAVGSESITYRDVQAQREAMRERMEAARPRRRFGRSRK